MNPSKCHLLVPKHTGDSFVRVGNEIIKGQSSVKLLGLTIDDKLDFTEHVTNLCKKASQKLHALSRIAPFIRSEKLQLLMKVFVNSQFNYCPLIWMFHNRTINNRINKIQERALRIAYNDTTSTFEQLLLKDNSVTVHEKNIQRLVIEIYKTKNNLVPTFMNEVFCSITNQYDIRNKSTLKTSNPKSVYNGTETITYRAPQIWTYVPDSIKCLSTLDEFKREIKKWKPKGCTCRLCRTYVSQLGFI